MANDEERTCKRQKVEHVNTIPARSISLRETIRQKLYEKFVVYAIHKSGARRDSYFERIVAQVIVFHDVIETRIYGHIIDLYEKLALENHVSDVLDRDNFAETLFIKNFAVVGISSFSRIWNDVVKSYDDDFTTLEDAYKKLACSQNKLFEKEISTINKFLLLICHCMVKCDMHKQLLKISRIFETMRARHRLGGTTISDEDKEHVKNMSRGIFHGWFERKNEYGLFTRVVYTFILNEKFMHISVDFIKMQFYTGDLPFDGFGEWDQEEEDDSEEEEEETNGTIENTSNPELDG